MWATQTKRRLHLRRSQGDGAIACGLRFSPNSRKIIGLTDACGADHVAARAVMGHCCHAVQVRCVDYQLVILFCLAAVWRKRMTSPNLVDSGRKSGRKYMSLVDHVRRFVRKWSVRVGKGKEDGGIVLGRGAACVICNMLVPVFSQS